MTGESDVSCGGKEKQGLDSAYFLVKDNRAPYNYGYDNFKTRLEREEREKKKRGFGCCYFLMFQDRDVTSTCWVNKVHVADPSSLHTHTHIHTHIHTHTHTHTHTLTHAHIVRKSFGRNPVRVRERILYMGNVIMR